MTKLATDINMLLYYHFLSEGQWRTLSLPIISTSMFPLKNVVRFYWWLNADNNLGGQTLTNERPSRD